MRSSYTYARLYIRPFVRCGYFRASKPPAIATRNCFQARSHQPDRPAARVKDRRTDRPTAHSGESGGEHKGRSFVARDRASEQAIPDVTKGEGGEEEELGSRRERVNTNHRKFCTVGIRPRQDCARFVSYTVRTRVRFVRAERRLAAKH